MIGFCKNILKTCGLRRERLETLWFKLNCRIPFKYFYVWIAKPKLFFCWIQNTLAGRTIICFPDQPREIGYEIVKISMILGVQIRKESANPHLGVAWQDTTVRTFLLPQKPAYFLNSHCPDIGKDKIEEVFESVFGYPLRIDPTTHNGTCARKSVLNAKHDGIVVNCPIEKAEPGYVYQRLINNKFDDEHIFDLRTPYYRGTLPLIYRKLRPIKTRFKDANAKVELFRTEDFFSLEERELLSKFGRALDLDYGGFDVLRDVETNKIYVVDVNTTPFGPPVELSTCDRKRALAILAPAFQKHFIDAFPEIVRERTVLVQTPVGSQ